MTACTAEFSPLRRLSPAKSAARTLLSTAFAFLTRGRQVQPVLRPPDGKSLRSTCEVTLEANLNLSWIRALREMRRRPQGVVAESLKEKVSMGARHRLASP